MADFYDLGQTVTITVTFTDSNGDPVDPGAVTLMVEDPSGNEATYDYSQAEITRDDTGDYSKDITTDEDGRWFARWDGVTDGNHTVVEYYFYVKPTVFVIS